MSTKISNLPAVIAASIQDTDIMPLVASAVTSKVTIAELRFKLGTQPPSESRTVTDAATYLYNNRVFHVDDYGAGLGNPDESVQVQNAFNAMIANGGGIVQFGPKTYRIKNIAPGGLTTVGYIVRGAGGTSTRLRPPTASPTNPIFDMTNENGPRKHFEHLKLEGANNGLFQSTGFKLNVTNGLYISHCWFAGLNLGITATTGAATGIWIANNIFEANGIAINIGVIPTEWSIWTNEFFDNVQSLQVLSGGAAFDCSTLVVSGFNDIGGGHTTLSVYINNVTNFAMSNFSIKSYVTGINVTNANDSMFTGGVLANTTDWATVGTTRLVVTNVIGNFAPFVGAGIYICAMVGEQRFCSTAGIPTSMAWTRGDRVFERVPVIGNAKGWTRVTTGSAHVAGTDWKTEGNL